MARTINGVVTGPVVLKYQWNPLTVSSTGTVTSTGSNVDAIDGGNGTWTIVNNGVISSTGGDGISLSGVGIVTNTATIKATGTAGIGIFLGGGGRVTNTSSGTISGGNLGVLATGFTTIANYGKISGGTNAGVVLGVGGVVNNGTAGTISGPGIGVYFQYHAPFGVAGAVNNSGKIIGTGTNSIGVVLADGGTIANNAKGSITATNVGVLTQRAGATLSNYGSISATYGVNFTAGGKVKNAASATITGKGIGVNGQGTAGQALTLNNTGTIKATSTAGLGVLLQNGGTVTNNAGGQISGSGHGVGVITIGTAATVVNSGSIQGYTGVDLKGGGLMTNYARISGTGSLYAAVGFDVSGKLVNAAGGTLLGGGGVYFGPNALATIVNSGSIGGSGGTGYGIFLRDGGQITNNAGGAISGTTVGIYSGSTVGAVSVVTLSNFGNISGGVAAKLVAGANITNNVGGLITGQVSVGDGTVGGGAGTVLNSGSFAGGSYPAIVLVRGGSVTNNAGGAITGTGAGVYFKPNAPGTVTNSGSIFGGGTSGSGVGLGGGGSITNNSGGSISGTLYGVGIKGAAGILTNSGQITATASGGSGVYLASGGSITNNAGASLAGGSAGVLVTGTAGATVTTAGTISGGTYAVHFANSGADLLVVNPGAVFAGGISGGSGANTLELTSGSGSIGGIGTGSITNFSTLTVDAGASWTLTGSNTIANVVALGTAVIGATVDISGSLDARSVGTLQLNGAATLEVAAAAGTATQIVFQSNGELIVDSAASFGVNVGADNYAGPLLNNFDFSDLTDTIDIKNFSAAGTAYAFNAATGVLQITNASSQAASLAFQTSSPLGGRTFQITSDGATGIFVTRI